MRRVRIKVCCISSVEEALLAAEAGADAVGLVGRMPSGPGPIEDDLIAEIAARVPPGVDSFLLTSETDPDAIVEHHRRCGTSVIQLVDSLTGGSFADLRRRMPGVRIVQVIHVRDAGAVEEATAAAREADAILLDSGNPGLAVKELGGTGRVHDWSVSRRIRDAVAPTPVYLAGGLHPGNAGDAIERVRPFGLDVCSGLRIGGQLDPAKLEAFVRAARG